MSRIELPDTKPEELRWKCWCGHWDVYANRESHLQIHKAEKKVSA